jgi:hypothetical protein
MAEALMKIYESMTAIEQKELYDFAMFLISKKQKDEINSLKEFCGVINDEDANVMMSSVEDCRKIEQNEW